MLGDIQIAEPGAEIGFAGARVIEQTVREKLPEGFQRSEFLLEKGALDMIVNRLEMREEIARVIALLEQHLAEPLSLEEIGRTVGCSPFHLSRTFSASTGMTIPQYLRQLRMERAAELLRTGRFNVTQTALEVGYSSLSHFSQAFHETFGCCPGLYPLKTPAQRAG